MPIIGPPPSLPHFAGSTPGCAAKLTSTTMASVGSKEKVPVCAPCPPTSSRLLNRTVSPQERFSPCRSCAQRIKAAHPARSSNAGDAMRLPNRRFCGARIKARSPEKRALPLPLLRPTSTAIRSMDSTLSSPPSTRCGGIQHITPVNGSLPYTVTGLPGRTRRSVPPQRSMRRKPSFSIWVTIKPT